MCNNRANIVHGVLAGIGVSPEALTRNVIHLAWYIHTYSHIHMKLFFYRSDNKIDCDHFEFALTCSQN